VRKAASVRYRLARLFLDRWYLESDATEREKLSVQAVGFSAAALYNFLRMRNVPGCVRARCLLSRALTAAEHFDAAKAQLGLVDTELGESDLGDRLLMPLKARFLRALGEYLSSRGFHREASLFLDDAVRKFETLSDYWSYCGTLRLLGNTERAAGRFFCFQRRTLAVGHRAS